jgi:hypothetical protein
MFNYRSRNFVAAIALLFVALLLVSEKPVDAAGYEDAVLEVLRAKLKEAGDILTRSAFVVGQPPLRCPCEDYCTGRCFAPQCRPCDASTWSFPGGESFCVNPFPLGEGLLCGIDPHTGNTTSDACCRVNGTSCQLDPTSCCADGGCSRCPSYPPQLKALFPPLNRTFDNDQCVQH